MFTYASINTSSSVAHQRVCTPSGKGQITLRRTIALVSCVGFSQPATLDTLLAGEFERCMHFFLHCGCYRREKQKRIVDLNPFGYFRPKAHGDTVQRTNRLSGKCMNRGFFVIFVFFVGYFSFPANFWVATFDQANTIFVCKCVQMHLLFMHDYENNVTFITQKLHKHLNLVSCCCILGGTKQTISSDLQLKKTYLNDAHFNKLSHIEILCFTGDDHNVSHIVIFDVKLTYKER